MSTDGSDAKTIFRSKHFFRPLIVTLALLLIPFLAMVFAWPVYDPGNPEPERVNWGVEDFIVAGVLLFTAGFVYEFFSRKMTTTRQKILLALGVLLVLGVIWVELAVGIFD